MTIETVRDVCFYINSNVNNAISIDNIASKFYFNKFHLMRKFKEVTGLTINQYINNQRIYNSMPMLISTDESILKIALNNGFNSPQYYSEQFTKTIGLSPLKFREFSRKYNYSPSNKGDNEMDKLQTIKSLIADLKELKELLNEYENCKQVQEPNKVKSLKPNNTKYV